MRQPSGMNNYYGQAKDRRNWQQSMIYRKRLIDKAEELNIKLDNPHAMKIRHLEELVSKHIGGVQHGKAHKT